MDLFYEIITPASYVIAVLFILLLTKSAITVAIDNRRQRRLLKRGEQIKALREEHLKKGLKEFSFANGKVILYAKDYKSANAKYQSILKNGMSNL